MKNLFKEYVVNNEQDEENKNRRQDIEDDADNVECVVEGENQIDGNETENIEQQEQRGSGLRQNLELIRGGSLYVHKNGICCRVNKLGKGLYLSPRPPIVVAAGDGLYVKTGATVYDGHGLLFGPNNIREKNPMLEILF